MQKIKCCNFKEIKEALRGGGGGSHLGHSHYSLELGGIYKVETCYLQIFAQARDLEVFELSGPPLSVIYKFGLPLKFMVLIFTLFYIFYCILLSPKTQKYSDKKIS